MQQSRNQNFSKTLEFKRKVENEPDSVDEEMVVKYANDIAKESKNVTYNQIRQVYGIIKVAARGEGDFDKKKLILAKPKIAYRKRNLKNDIVDLYLSFIDQVVNKKIEFRLLKEFTEALIAYMKYYEKNK